MKEKENCAKENVKGFKEFLKTMLDDKFDAKRLLILKSKSDFPYLNEEDFHSFVETVHSTKIALTKFKSAFIDDMYADLLTKYNDEAFQPFKPEVQINSSAEKGIKDLFIVFGIRDIDKDKAVLNVTIAYAIEPINEDEAMLTEKSYQTITDGRDGYYQMKPIIDYIQSEDYCEKLDAFTANLHSFNLKMHAAIREARVLNAKAEREQQNKSEVN